MKITRDVACCLRPPALFCQTNSMLAGNHTSPREHLCEKFIEGGINFFTHARVAVVTIRHDINVNVAITCMAKTCNGKSMLRLKLLDELDKIDNVTARHDHILIQFC